MLVDNTPAANTVFNTSGSGDNTGTEYSSAPEAATLYNNTLDAATVFNNTPAPGHHDTVYSSTPAAAYRIQQHSSY
jgi:hypothetical protein